MGYLLAEYEALCLDLLHVVGIGLLDAGLQPVVVVLLGLAGDAAKEVVLLPHYG